MTAKSRKAPTKPLTNQEQFDKLKDRIVELGSLLWEEECHVNLYEGTHLEVSAGDTSSTSSTGATPQRRSWTVCGPPTRKWSSPSRIVGTSSTTP